ncbi:MAG: hypothetical protein JXA90_06135 [Planctomycetes bacterium]|nr:hypothetical protein [Planctomycetota bacterium]
MALAALCLQAAASGCSLDVARVRSGEPLKLDRFEELEEGKTTKIEALEKLGAPDRVSWETDQERLFWDRLDTYYASIRFQLPLSLYGYRHNLYQYFRGQDQYNTMELLFDEEGVLEQKSLRLPAAYREERPESSWRWHIAPRFEHSFLLMGSGDFDDYRKIFRNGYAAGLDVGVQPVAPLIFSLGGAYQSYAGRPGTRSFLDEDENIVPRRVSPDDLDLYTLEAKIRLQVPLRLFADAESFRDFWTILLDEAPETHDGWAVFVEAGVGATYNENVPVAIDGARRGNLFDSSIQLSSSGTTGIEYSARRISARLGIIFRAQDGFDEGSSPLEADAESFQSWGAFASVALKF